MKTALPYAAIFFVIVAGLASVNMRGWERDERHTLERTEGNQRRAQYEERATRGPYVADRTNLSPDEQLVPIAIPDRSSRQ